jgi:MADS-box transcription factor
MGKKDADDEEDEEEEGALPRDSHTPPEHAMMPQHMQHSQFQHIRHTASMSPPIGNGVPFQQRGPSPQPPHHLSRPNSRVGHIRRPSSNLAPPQPYPSQAPPPQNNYAYMPNPPFYNPQAQQMAPKPQPTPPAVQYQFTHPMPTNAQVQYMQEQQRRQSMPPMPQQQQQQQQQQHQQQHPQQQMQHQQPPQQQQQQQQPPPPPPPQVSQPPQERPQQPTITVPSPPQHNDFQSPPLPQPKPLHASARHSIFTPIDDSQSMLAAHWGSSSNTMNQAPYIKQENRSLSIDVAAMSRPQPNGEHKPLPQASQSLPIQQPPQRTQSTSSMSAIPPPSRTNSLRMSESKPRLRVQIPSEQSDAGSATADSSPKDSGTTGATPGRSTDASHSSGVVLPPPSPSANSLLSAGATGPPNPFARPPPPSNSNSYNSRNDIETPISALPSRFVEGNLLPSPSSFYPDWNFGRDSNMLPSPLNFQTPVAPSGPSFARDDSTERKRKTSDQGSDDGSQKRIKT